jgi:hypothetical protein
MAREQPADPEEEIRPPVEEETFCERNPAACSIINCDDHPVWCVVLLAGFVLLAFVLALFLVKVWRRLAPALASARAMPRVGYRLVLDRLGEAGFSRQFGETREAFAKRVGDVAPTFQKLTDMHVAARLGNPQADPKFRDELQPSHWKRLMRQTRREISGGTKLWRRILGLLHPASFIDSR